MILLPVKIIIKVRLKAVLNAILNAILLLAKTFQIPISIIMQLIIILCFAMLII